MDCLYNNKGIIEMNQELLRSKCCKAKVEQWGHERVEKYTKLEPNEQLFCQGCGRACETIEKD